MNEEEYNIVKELREIFGHCEQNTIRISELEKKFGQHIIANSEWGETINDKIAELRENQVKGARNRNDIIGKLNELKNYLESVEGNWSILYNKLKEAITIIMAKLQLDGKKEWERKLEKEGNWANDGKKDSGDFIEYNQYPNLEELNSGDEKSVGLDVFEPHEGDLSDQITTDSKTPEVHDTYIINKYEEGYMSGYADAKFFIISEFLEDYKKYISLDTDTELYKKWEEKLK